MMEPESEKINKNTTKIIKIYDKKCENEIKINEIILNIPFYYNYFSLFTNWGFINDSFINENYFDFINNNEERKNSKYILIEREKNELIDFHIFFQNSKNIYEFIYKFIHSYKNLLYTINILNNNNICYFDLKYDKISFDNYGFPLLYDFEEAICYTDFKLLNNYIPNYYIFPLEVHVISYMNDNDIKSISREIIEKICKNYVIRNRALLIMNEELIVDYYKKCVTSLLKYINIPREKIITELTKYMNTWDNYSLSIIYLQLLRNIYKNIVYENKSREKNNEIDEFYNFFSLHLLSGIEPEPEKRIDNKNMLKQMEILFDDKIGIRWNKLYDKFHNIKVENVVSNMIDDINHINKILIEFI